MSNWLSQALVALFAVGLFSLADAAPIEYRVVGTGSGDLAGLLFSDAPFEIHAVGDTASVTLVDVGVSVIPLQSLSIAVDSLAIIEASNPTYFFVNQVTSGAGFFDFFVGDFLDFVAGPFATYNGTSNLGPLGVAPDYLNAFDTTGGVLLFSSVADLSFGASAASAVSEPGTISLATLSLLVLLRARRFGLADGDK